MPPFEERRTIASKWENEVKDRLESIGFITNPYGQGVNLEDEFRDAIRFMNDNLTAKFVRYQPDLIIAKKNKACYFVEAKSETKGDTPNFSYELASHEAGMMFHSIGVNVIVVFTGWRADFICNLKIFQKLEDPEYLIGVKGSRTPFGLIMKDTVPLFDDFFASIVKNGTKSDVNKFLVNSENEKIGVI